MLTLPSARATLVLGALGAVVFLAGCGDRDLILRIDLLSFLDPGERTTHYGPIPPALGDTVTVISSRRVNLLPGLQDVTVVRAVTLELAAEIRNQTGSGSGTIGLYISGPGSDPFVADTSPLVVPFAVAGADTDTVSVTLAGDQELAELFTGKEAELGIRAAIQSGIGPAPLEGDLVLTRILAIVTAKRGDL